VGDKAKPPVRQASADSYATLPDSELIERCLKHDEDAWVQIVARFRRRVFHISYKFTGRAGDAEDLTQEIFLRLFRCLDKFNRDADFATWLTSVARNHCIDHYRAAAGGRGARPQRVPASRSQSSSSEAAGGRHPARSDGAELRGDGRPAGLARRNREEPHQPRA
jgi:RNA polymerase sigma factor (sigma-70 family)